MDNQNSKSSIKNAIDKKANNPKKQKKSFFQKNNSSTLLKEKDDIDYGKNKPSLISYYIFGSIKWILSFWYITIPAIIIGGFVVGSSALQYLSGNDKPVWGTRNENLVEHKELKSSIKRVNEANKDKNYAHFRVYNIGPEIHIEIGLDKEKVTNYGDAKNKINSVYKDIISPLEDKKGVKSSYSVQAIVTGKEPSKTDTALHATKSKQKDKFYFYHK